MTTPPFPADFYGVVDVPFHRFLDVAFTRDDPRGEAIIRIPAEPGETGPRSPAAVFAAAEIGAAITATDAIWPHVAGTDLQPILLTTGASLTSVRPAVGEIRALSRFACDAGETFSRLVRRRKARCLVEVELRDEGDGAVARARVDLYLRLMSADRWMALSGATTAGPGRDRVAG
jgi:hypothetical protein